MADEFHKADFKFLSLGKNEGDVPNFKLNLQMDSLLSFA